jgi:CO/xanthine dehydrogenase Mo-binding subunit
VQVKLDRSGKVTLFSGASDIGQGSNSVVAYLIAEELGCEPSAVNCVVSDTDLTPVDLGAYSSRVTFMIGNATIMAGRELRSKLDAAVAESWGCAPSDIQARLGTVFQASHPAKNISFAEAVQLAEAKFGTLGSTGWYKTPKLGGDYRGGTIGASPAYSFTAHVAEVSVDVETGIWKCERLWAAHDCGKALNPTLVEGQIEGSMYMGWAEAAMEEQTYDGRGLHKGPSLLDYRIPTSMDVPDMKALIVESHDPEGPWGAKEAGEGPLHPAIPAIANAIYDAVGVRVKELPFHASRILKLMREKSQREAAP